MVEGNTEYAVGRWNFKVRSEIFTGIDKNSLGMTYNVHVPMN